MEEAKRRLIYSLIKLKLPTPSLASGEQEALVFDFLADLPEQKVMTGHEDGVITISLSEADDAAREQLRTSLHEPYRTLLGHFRHEVGHFYWDRLVRDGGHVESFRALFGDERADYAEALKRYYENGPAPNWRDNFVSAYATAHPWEDFAETWAHYLHIVDTLEMAYAFHLSVNPRVEEAPSTTVDRSPYKARDVATLLAAWLPVTFAVNNLNRSMGQPDLYPFVISGAAIAKLQYIHDLIRGTLPKGEAVSRDPVSKASSRSSRRWRWRDALTQSFRSMIGGPARGLTQPATT
jgi:hypothetical protein